VKSLESLHFLSQKNGDDEVTCHWVNTQELIEFLAWSGHLVPPPMLKASHWSVSHWKPVLTYFWMKPQLS